MHVAGARCCRSQKLLLPNGLEAERAPSQVRYQLSSSARHIDFQLLHPIYVALIAHLTIFTLSITNNNGHYQVALSYVTWVRAHSPQSREHSSGSNKF